ncbi:hypothetical protein M2451_003229 [Dysgonomonas sp. PFB1-18]|uniref:hypothetical protein n=1 Tax=unclassified Dysgonomonas TaxID=2630389 RepID=UPI0024742EBF|nr:MULTISPECIES: hypothetical protein [unclassified Dysgonomonas]MDL2302779.1 hypothetical protein [Dysgonomonas sp. OttesenSCG-928-D17]MDH6310342.1 hypothetical protein [Dysgonomonas sp. PF1-14]MDH6340328.1 hypothetical protein [Dysgonomonas sp. PF1-16]MDH6381892.1 hypothetical protein [Dysgonomonas sp. PFB1-18]MDH6399299.1 hypothetical protein [Dysgonomonas sp. PF1-23]
MKDQSKKDLIIEILIAIIPFGIGGLLIYRSIYLIYGYHFTNSLWFVMLPMTTLVLGFILGTLLVISAILIFVNKPKGAFLYRLSGLFIILYPININIIDFLKGYQDNLDSWWITILIPIGLLVFLFFNQKKYVQTSKSYKKEILLIVLFIFLLTDIAFYNWNYSEYRRKELAKTNKLLLHGVNNYSQTKF